MVAAAIGPLISAGASLLGGLLGKSSAEKQNAANLALQREMAEKNIQLQRDFAQQGIRWKTEDAKAAGIHPIYALGAPTHNFSPVNIGALPGADMSMSNAVNSMGQDIGRAVNATRTASDREDAYTTSVKALTLQKFGLENDLLAAQIAKLSPLNPPFPDPQVADPFFPQEKPKGRPSLMFNDIPWYTHGGSANANEFEDRYGESSDYSWGPAVLWRDLVHNFAVRMGPAQRSGARKMFPGLSKYIPK